MNKRKGKKEEPIRPLQIEKVKGISKGNEELEGIGREVQAKVSLRAEAVVAYFFPINLPSRPAPPLAS